MGAASGAQSSRVLTPGPRIASDCSVDVSAPLQRFFSSVPNGSTVRLARDGCYRIEREIDVIGKDRISLDGHGAVLRRTTLSPPELQYPHWNAMIKFINVTRSSITGLNIRGINTVSDKPELRPRYGAWGEKSGFDHGIALLGVQDVTLSDSTVDAVFGDGVYIGGSDQFPRAKRVQVRNVAIDRNGRQGIAITSAARVLLDDVTISHSRRSGIDMEPHRDKVVSKVEIKNSTITSRLLAITGSGVGTVNDVFIHNNTFLRSALPLVHDRSSGVGTQRRYGWQVVDNKVAFTVRSSAAAMVFGNTDDVLVQGNDITFELGSGLAVLVGKTHAIVRCNRFKGAIASYVLSDPTSAIRVVSNSRDHRKPVCKAPAVPGWVMNAADKPGKPSTRPTPQQPQTNRSPGSAREANKPTRHGTQSPALQNPKQTDAHGAAAGIAESSWLGLTALLVVFISVALLGRWLIDRGRH